MKLHCAIIPFSPFTILPSSFSAPPNLIRMMADDLGYADLGRYVQKFKVNRPKRNEFDRTEKAIPINSIMSGLRGGSYEKERESFWIS